MDDRIVVHGSPHGFAHPHFLPGAAVGVAHFMAHNGRPLTYPFRFTLSGLAVGRRDLSRASNIGRASLHSDLDTRCLHKGPSIRCARKGPVFVRYDAAPAPLVY